MTDNVLAELTVSESANDKIDELLVLKKPTNTINIYLTISASDSMLSVFDGSNRLGYARISNRFAIGTIYEIKNGDELIGLAKFKANSNSSLSAINVTDYVFDITRNNNLYTYYLKLNNIYDLNAMLMTSAEKSKLNGIEAQANKTLYDTTLSNAGQAADAKATGDILNKSILLPLTENASSNDRLEELLILKEPANSLNIYMTISEPASMISLMDGTDRIGILQLSSRFALNTIYEIKNGDELVGLALFKVNANSTVSAVPLTDAVFNTTRNSKLYTYFLEANGIYNLPEYIGEHVAGSLSNVSLGTNPVTIDNRTAIIPAASTTTDGYMSKTDKQKLDSIVNPVTITISGSGVTKNASAYGFLPTNDGVTNATNLQAAIDAMNGGGTILVDYPGTYEISRSIIVPSNTSLVFGENVFLKRVTDSNHKFGRYVFINSGAIDGTYNENIQIHNLNVLPNGNLEQGDGNVRDLPEIYGVRGLVVMARIKNLIIDGYTVLDRAFMQYAAQITFFENVVIKNVHIETSKDGLHFGTGKRFIVRNCKFMTEDDAIALNTIDYPMSNIGIGDITDGTIEDIYILAPSGSYTWRRGILLLTGAWQNWQSGNSYQKYGDVCVNNGVIYQTLTPGGPTTDQLVSTVAPTHQSGAVMYSDGLQWLAKQNVNAVLHSNVKNVSFRNIYFERGVPCGFFIISTNSEWCRAVYPGTEELPNENLIFENVHFFTNAPSNQEPDIADNLE